jgi:hypothetical protein
MLCCQEEEPIDSAQESWENIISGEYEGGLEIFCEGDSFYMENITLTIKRNNDSYTLILESIIKLRSECLTLTILSIENNSDENDIIHIDINENQYYKTREVGAYNNVIYINDIFYDEVEGPNAEIRLSLICLTEHNIRHIFIRAKKFF